MSDLGERIALRDDQGQIHEFRLIDVVEIGAHRYAVLQPPNGELAVVFRLEDDTLVAIDDDAEFERVVEVLQESEDYAEVTLVDGDSAHLDQSGTESSK